MKYVAWIEMNEIPESRQTVEFECESTDPDVIENEARQAVMDFVSWGFFEKDENLDYL